MVKDKITNVSINVYITVKIHDIRSHIEFSTTIIHVYIAIPPLWLLHKIFENLFYSFLTESLYLALLAKLLFLCITRMYRLILLISNRKSVVYFIILILMLKYIVGKIFQIYKRKYPPTRIFDNKTLPIFPFGSRDFCQKEKRNVEQESSYANLSEIPSSTFYLVTTRYTPRVHRIYT